MGYHYDPILCMNVPDAPSKAKDAKALDDARSDFSKVIALTKQIDEITRKYARKIDANAMFTYTEQIRNKVQYYIDNASRGWYDAAPSGVRDADIKLVQTIASKNGYAVHVVESDYGKRVVLTFKGESYKNPHMWLGEATEGNKRKAIEMMNEFAKKAGSKNHDSLDRAIRNCDAENERWITMNGSHVKIDGE